MQTDGWKYYNHAVIPTTPPHQNPDTTLIEDGSIWKISGKPLFARWTTDFDCGYETNWWYVVKDSPFDINVLKAKRRYEINKGIKNFDVRPINVAKYKEAMYTVQTNAFAAYPEKYRPIITQESFFEDVAGWNTHVVLGAFFRETNELVGYTMLFFESEKYVNFCVLKADPAFERYGINAALCAGVLVHFNDFLSNGGLISDGSRSVNHETHFQEYLEKNFGFRKAYCNLHMKYNPRIKLLVSLLYPFRKLFSKFDNVEIVHSVNSVLKMESICRNEEFI